MATSDGLEMKKAVDVGNEHWNIKMNDIASNAIANGCKNFPNNSLLVKEKHDASGAITGFDIMLRTSGDFRSENGWLFRQLDNHGGLVGGGSKNLNCNSCHAQESQTSKH
jgi:hypothetical protein